MVESVLLYGSEACTLTKKHEKKLDGTYTRMLRAILNISWKEHPTNNRLYGNIPPLTKIYVQQLCDDTRLTTEELKIGRHGRKLLKVIGKQSRSDKVR